MISVEEWLDNNQLAIDIWKKKYQYNNESFEDWLQRISDGYEPLKRLIIEKKFLPGGRILANRGIPIKGITYSNCYVLSVEDSIESIYKCCSEMARTYSYGGGVGIDISNLRPKGASVNNSAKETSGAVSFMKTFDVVTETIGQSGRRGALMLSMDIRHPDIEEFINIKANTTEITHANISVRVNDEFMKAVENNEDYILRWPCGMNLLEEAAKEIKPEYNKLTPVYGNPDFSSNRELFGYVKKVRAKELYTKLCKNNWDYAEPGILFWDKIESWNMMSADKNFKYAGVNPCAEEPLPNYGACLLGSFNLSEYVKDNYIDYKSLLDDTDIAIRSLNVIQNENIELHPLKGQTDTALKYRQIGLGIMGLADLFVKLEITYGSEMSLKVTNDIMKTILIQAFKTSCNIYKEEECYIMPFMEVENSDFYREMIKPNIPKEIKERPYPYNSQLLTIAPTGTLSTMLNISGGAEPIFELGYYRTTKSLHGKDVTYKVYPKVIKEYMDKHNLTEEELPDFITKSISGNVPITDRINMQKTLQRWIDASISSTINLPEETTVGEVSNLYMNAWKAGLKGVTIFRQGCKRTAILSKNEQNYSNLNVVKRPRKLPADFHSVKANGEKFYVIVGLYDNKPYEIFIIPNNDIFTIPNHIGTIEKIGKAHYKYDSDEVTIDNIAMEEQDYKNITLNVSLALRHNIPIKYIIHTVKKANSNITSVNSAICRILNKYAPNETGKCPECGGELVNEGGCSHCNSCGYSKCMLTKKLK